MNTITFEYFRLVLTESTQRSLLKQKTRSEIIENIFLNDFDFLSNKNTEYKYKFKAKNGNYILGQIFKKQNIEIIEDPNNAKPCKHLNWIPEFVIINNGIQKGENAQLFLLQKNSHRKENKSLTFLNNSLAGILNKNLETQSSIFRVTFTKVLDDKMNFWDFSNREDIKELIIDYKMPNFLGIGDSTKELNERLKHIQEQTNATQVKEIIINKDKNLMFKKEDSDLDKTLELAKQGQSSIILKGAKQKIIYDSDKNEQIKSKEISIDELNITGSSMKESESLLNSILTGLGLNNENNI